MHLILRKLLILCLQNDELTLSWYYYYSYIVTQNSVCYLCKRLKDANVSTIGRAIENTGIKTNSRYMFR